MKRNIVFAFKMTLAVAMLAAATLVGCKKDPVTPDNPNTPDTPDTPDVPEVNYVPQSLVYDGETLSIDRLFLREIQEYKAYCFISGSLTSPNAEMDVIALREITLGTYTFIQGDNDEDDPSLVWGGIGYYSNQQLTGQYEIVSGTMTVTAEGAGYLYRIDAIDNEGKSLRLSYTGLAEPFGGSGSGQCVVDGTTIALDQATLAHVTQSGITFTAFDFRSSENANFIVEFDKVGQEIPAGEYDLVSPQNAYNGVFGAIINGMNNMDYFAEGTLSIAISGSTYTVTSQGTTQAGKTFSMNYTGTIQTLSKTMAGRLLK